MGRDHNPVPGKWYESLDDEEVFKVLSVDEDAELIELQYEDGDVEEIDYETWQELDLTASSPGSFVMIEAVFERSRAAFSFLGQRGVRAEALGARAARAVLKFLEGEAAVDPHLADQMALPLALAGCGGRISTSEVTGHLETVASVLRLFGWSAEVWGRRGGPGGLEVAR